MGKKQDEEDNLERAIARDFTMARLAAARVHVTAAAEAIDAFQFAMVDPESDPKGKDRAVYLETCDDALGAAAIAVHAAQTSWDEVDPEEGEPDPDDDEEEDEDEDEDDED